MAHLGDFNANDVQPAVGFDPIPAGKYLAVIADSELKPTKSESGNYLELRFQVIDGEHKDRLLWSRLNLENANATAVKMARAELSAICRAVGVMAPKDSIELHDLPLMITVAHKQRAGNGEITNVIKGYSKKDAVTQAPPADTGKPPWAK
jgi:hypothetical protein